MNRIEWTKKTPTESGAYFLRRVEEADGLICQIHEQDAEKTVFFTNPGLAPTPLASFEDYEWLGPVAAADVLLIESSRQRDVEVLRWIGDICERNKTHVDSLDTNDVPLDVTLGDIRGLTLSDHSVLFALARRAIQARNAKADSLPEDYEGHEFVHLLPSVELVKAWMVNQLGCGGTECKLCYTVDCPFAVAALEGIEI